MEAYLAIHIPQQMAQTNMPDPTSWLRVTNKSGEDAQSGLALFIYAPVETSKGACLPMETVVRDIAHRDSEIASERAAIDELSTTKKCQRREIGGASAE